jgi:hypothetical protein
MAPPPNPQPLPPTHNTPHRLNPDGTQTTLAAFYQSKRINSPNDLTFGPQSGDLYLCVGLFVFLWRVGWMAWA